MNGLMKENLRDNMTNEELVLNMLAELSTTSITKSKDPQTLEENMQCAADGGNAARVAREELEAKTGRSVVSPMSANRFFESQQVKNIKGENKEKKISLFVQQKKPPLRTMASGPNVFTTDRSPYCELLKKLYCKSRNYYYYKQILHVFYRKRRYLCLILYH